VPLGWHEVGASSAQPRWATGGHGRATSLDRGDTTAIAGDQHDSQGRAGVCFSPEGRGVGATGRPDAGVAGDDIGGPTAVILELLGEWVATRQA
jgi:hypothetical protein